MSISGDLGRAKVEVVRWDGNVGLLNKYNYGVGRKCEDMKATVNTMLMTYQKEETNHHQSLFLSAQKGLSVETYAAEIQGIVKVDGFRMTIYPYDTEMHNRTFHFGKRTTTETTYSSLLCQNVTAITDAKNIQTTALTYWRGFIVLCPFEPDELDADG